MPEPPSGLTIQNNAIRVYAVANEGKPYLVFQHREPGGPWRTVLATGMETRWSMWTRSDPVVFTGDPMIEWSDNVSFHTEAGLFKEAALENDGRELILRTTTAAGKRLSTGPHEIEERVAISGPNRITIKVTDRINQSCSEIRLGKLMSHFYFLPDDKVGRGAEPLDFAWLPNLHWDYDHVVGDHVFRSPAAIVQFDGLYAALVPDLDLLAENRPKIRHALDLRAVDVRMAGEDDAEAQVPRLYYGFCTWNPDGHTYYKHDPADRERVGPGELSYGFDLFLGRSDGPEEIVGLVNAYLWDRYGRRHFEDIRPQVLPFEEYGRKYAYVNELPRTVKRVTVGSKNCAGINNPGRRGSNFHGWENDLHMGFGIRHYADKWSNAELRGIADGIRQLILSAPRKGGAFPCIFNFETGAYEGSLFWTARAGDPYNGYDTAAMGVSSWWMLYWHERFGNDPEFLESVTAYARFLAEVQRPSGAVPTYFFSDLRPAMALLESATTAISGAVLAKAARLTGDAELKKAALAAGRFVDEEVLPELAFYDYETFYSCSSKPLHWIDPVSGIRPQNTLSVQWACDQFLALYRLTGDEHWLRRGRYLVGLLSFYHQVWRPPYYNVHVFGGFGVMNTDGEWNDGRQARFASTYADYYEATGRIEYLERAVAACRASFALMDIEENHANAITPTVWPPPIGPGLGHAPENVFHSGPGDSVSGWSGFNWSAGGGLAASAFLERKFGAVWVDGQAKQAVPVDGVAASVMSWDGTKISLEVTSALKNLDAPYTEGREVVVKFGRMPERRYTVTINGQEFKDLASDELGEGVGIQLS